MIREVGPRSHDCLALQAADGVGAKICVKFGGKSAIHSGELIWAPHNFTAGTATEILNIQASYSITFSRETFKTNSFPLLSVVNPGAAPRMFLFPSERGIRSLRGFGGVIHSLNNMIEP